MTTNKTTMGTGTHTASFRISEEQHQDFVELLESVPGSDVGNMYREIFASGGVDPRYRPIVKATADRPTRSQATGPSPEASVEDRCRKRYGFYDPRLLLSINEKTGKVTIKPNVFNYHVILENEKDLDL
jgi:hypothetical protein